MEISPKQRTFFNETLWYKTFKTALKRPHFEKTSKYVDFATALENIEQTLRQHFSEKFGSMPFDLDG